MTRAGRIKTEDRHDQQHREKGVPRPSQPRSVCHVIVWAALCTLTGLDLDGPDPYMAPPAQPCLSRPSAWLRRTWTAHTLHQSARGHRDAPRMERPSLPTSGPRRVGFPSGRTTRRLVWSHACPAAARVWCVKTESMGLTRPLHLQNRSAILHAGYHTHGLQGVSRRYGNRPTRGRGRKEDGADRSSRARDLKDNLHHTRTAPPRTGGCSPHRWGYTAGRPHSPQTERRSTTQKTI